MIHVDMASTPRNRQRSPRHGQGTSSRDATAASSPYHGTYTTFSSQAVAHGIQLD